MIIKGGPRGKGRELATHLMRADTNEKVRVFDTHGVFSGTVRGALAEMEAVAAGSRVKRPLYHVSINPEANETLTPAQWRLAADRLEKALGMEGHQRVMVEHLKHGRSHMHVAWCRVDPETMKAAHHSHNYRTHEEVARSLEREFGLKRTQGVHAERDTEKKKPRERPTTHESQQEARTGWKKADAQAAILDAWANCQNGAEFRDRLEAGGYRLAHGDKRDYVVVDPAGGPHSIRSGVKGLRVAEIRERFDDLAEVALPSVAEAQKAARDGYAEFLKAREPEKAQSAARPVAFSYRPTVPQPGRYDVLRAATPSARPESTQSPPQRPVAAPQLTPNPPTWAREATAQPKQTATPDPRQPATPEASPQAAPSAALQDLQARQQMEWTATLARMGQAHDKAHSALEDHHAKRLTTINVDVDARLKELNGLTSRAGALLNPADRDREIAYLVAKRQRSLADEKARQQATKDDLRRAQDREIEAAKAKHDRLNTFQQKALEIRLKRETDREHKPIQPNNNQRPPGPGREP